MRFNLVMNYRRKILIKTKRFKPPRLSKNEKKAIKEYYRKKGYKNIKTQWHQYFSGFNKHFSVKYIPEDIFHPIIAPILNNHLQWPALLDKNLLYRLFNDVKQPSCIISNINGFYYNQKELISLSEAVELCSTNNFLVIKPSIESGGGNGVIGFSVNKGRTSYKSLSIKELFLTYSKDFIVQEVVKQHPDMKKLNPSSLNTIRVLSYLKNDSVYLLSSIVRIGKLNSFTDNSSSGGISCGINPDGSLKQYGFNQAGEQRFESDSGIRLATFKVPEYKKVKELVKKVHIQVPYFKLIAWDIAIDYEEAPVLIEYNTYKMGISSLQLANGPLFGEFTDELLEIGENYKPLT
ncbi:sugar-transfer associated ATP-grasp domain-containing protein [Tamlana sp. 2201CG12-4]|uniref:sugar-transfer associated ATP-grasp domain-containing protein n=1 Tax=Tamlana sp. 2201CG12-4 TaxID=3112582 RepID=UPI002DBAE0EC|nr:sugar-transfer associated ATP-grasp domain-containing protein [Tamlana sp. 2201CG12-4]MEC3907983.1 sugar-transfer associated ATP-grasp domain-containing protein [Tamlana sp. 2201CG12-4]